MNLNKGIIYKRIQSLIVFTYDVVEQTQLIIVAETTAGIRSEGMLAVKGYSETLRVMEMFYILLVDSGLFPFWDYYEQNCYEHPCTKSSYGHMFSVL